MGVAGCPVGFPESSRKTSHTVSHSHSKSVKSIRRLAWKEEVVKVIKALVGQCVGRSVGGSKDLNMDFKCGFCGKDWNTYECVLINEWGPRSLLQDSRANFFRWQ